MTRSNESGVTIILSLLSVCILLWILMCQIYKNDFITTTEIQGTIISKDIVSMEVEYIGSQEYIGECGGMRGTHSCTKYRPVVSTRIEDHYVFTLDNTDEQIIVSEREYNKYNIGDFIEVEKNIDDNNIFNLEFIDYDIK